MFLPKYKPTTQKTLFHKDVINHIRKWIKNIENMSEYKQSVKTILFIHGPVSCGKSITIDVLFKGFNTIKIDSSDVRSTEKINEVSLSITAFNEKTLSHMTSVSSKASVKKNIVVVDNIDLCEKNITCFVETIHDKRNIDVPIILLCNNSRLKDMFTNHNNCTFVEFKLPSLLELYKLTTEIVTIEKINLSHAEKEIIINKSQYDIRQLLHILEQWKYSSIPFEEFISNVAIKHIDTDLASKLGKIFDNTKYEFDSIFDMCSSEPLAISCNIFQNYSSTSIDMSSMSTISDYVSQSDTLQALLFDEQAWDLYNHYTVQSCVAPCYIYKKETTMGNVTTVGKLGQFRDISYNFINSYEEVKKLMMRIKPFTTKIVYCHNSTSSFDSCYQIALLLVTDISFINDYYESNKKKKNTSKQEKIDLCKMMPESIKKRMERVTNTIYTNNMFEADTNSIVLKIKTYTGSDDKNIITDINEIDIRILKRFINIFTIGEHNTSSKLKSHVETAIKYTVFLSLVNDIEEYLQNCKVVVKDMDHLVEDLSNIWNI